MFPKLKSRRTEWIVKICRDKGKLSRKAIDKHTVKLAGMKASFPNSGSPGYNALHWNFYAEALLPIGKFIAIL